MSLSIDYMYARRSQQRMLEKVEHDTQNKARAEADKILLAEKQAMNDAKALKTAAARAEQFSVKADLSRQRLQRAKLALQCVNAAQVLFIHLQQKF